MLDSNKFSDKSGADRLVCAAHALAWAAHCMPSYGAIHSRRIEAAAHPSQTIQSSCLKDSNPSTIGKIS